MPRNTQYLAITLVIIIFTTVAVLLISSSGDRTPSPQSPLTSIMASSEPQAGSLKVISIAGDGDQVAVDQFIKINFNGPVNPSDLSISLTPADPSIFRLGEEGRSLIIEPETVWHNNTDYQLIINNSPSSKSLEKESIINFKTVPYKGF